MPKTEEQIKAEEKINATAKSAIASLGSLTREEKLAALKQFQKLVNEENDLYSSTGEERDFSEKYK